MTEPLAIIGIGCRFPGRSNTPHEFWNLLLSGTDAITEIPPDRFDLSQLFDPAVSKPGTIYTRWGGFLENIDQFDAAFFGISPREAARMDPQHRLLLEASWEALEDAGIPADRIAGTDVGVFVGISTHDYGDVQMYPVNRELLDHHSNTGSTVSIAANRISHFLDFRGPSLAVDTACSSALTAVHLASASLRAGECQLALVGGVQILLTPEPTMGFCRATMLSPTGTCKAFDARADGYVRSEGVGVVAIKPLSLALADRDPVYAVILGSAVNQDGRTTGLTVPSGAAQEEMLRRALDNAGVSASDVQYIEAHGTGTPVGDPIEAAALGAVMGGGRLNGHSCAIGSVKTNIGHLEAASGIAGLIKTTLAISHRQLPASLHFERANPAIDFDALGLRVVTAAEPWPAEAGKAVAGVNGFGFGGANSHVLVGEAPVERQRLNTQSRTPRVDTAWTGSQLLAISARSVASLQSLAREYLSLLTGDHGDVHDLCAAAALRRTHHAHRLAVVGTTAEDLAEGIDAFLAGERRASVLTGRAATPAPSLAFVFSGMGPQWWGMARSLIENVPLVRNIIERCDRALAGLADWSLLETLLADETSSRAAQPDRAQLTGVAVQIALIELYKSWGIRPDAVTGHSAGEMAAAYAAGVHDLEDVARLAYHRGRLQARATGQGRMLAAGVALADVSSWLERYPDRLFVAAVNAPEGLTLSGDADLLARMQQELEQRQKFARFLQVAVPYHSAKMDPIRDELLASLRDLKTQKASVPLVSVVTGTWSDGLDFTAEYWWRNVRQPVQFASGMQSLIDAGHLLCLEVGPHPVLAASVGECLAAANVPGTVVASLRRFEDDRSMLLQSMAALYVAGRAIDWSAIYPGITALVPLPTYAWDRTRHWFEPRSERSWNAEPRIATDANPLLQRSLPSAVEGWQSRLSDPTLAYIGDHRVQGAIVFPGAGFVEMALAAVSARRPQGQVVLGRLEFRKALFVSDDAEQAVQFVFDGDGSRFDIFSGRIGSASGEWTRHATGAAAIFPTASTERNLVELRRSCAEAVSREACYATFAARGLDYGGHFQGIEQAWKGEREALAIIRGSAADADRYCAHPALLDAALQLMFIAAPGEWSERDALYLPVQIDEVRFNRRPGSTFWAHARLHEATPSRVVGDVTLMDDDGRVAIEIRGVVCHRVNAARGETLDDWLYEAGWQPSDDVLGAPAFSAESLERVMRLQSEVDLFSRNTGWHSYYEDVEVQLDALALQCIVGGLRALGLRLEPGHRIAWSDVRARVPASRAKFARRLMAILADRGSLEMHGDSWLVRRLPEQVDVAVLAGHVRNRWPAYDTEVALLERCGADLARNLTGAVSATETLFSTDAAALMDRFYQDAPPSKFYNTVITKAIEAIRPPAGVRVLEIGGGTGGATSAVLAQLSGIAAEYVFTDVSAAFVERAAQRWHGRTDFSARVFDLEVSAAAQGLSSNSFELVIAANVVHATRDVTASLANIRSLLAPGGLLILLEITRRPLWLDLIFGLTDGWWRFEDRFRTDHALLPAADWQRALRDAGFDAVAALADSEHSGEAGQAVLTALEPSEGARTDDCQATGEFLILDSAQGFGRTLADRLRIQAVSCTVLDASASSSDIRRWVDGLDVTTATRIAIVHMRSLDLDPPGTDTAVWLAGQAAAAAATIEHLQACVRPEGRSAPTTFWLITAGAQHHGSDSGHPLAIEQSPVWGLGRVVMKEVDGVRCRLVDLPRDITRPCVEALARELTSNTEEEEIAIRGGQRFVRRLRRVHSDALPPRRAGAADGAPEWRAEIQTPGALQTIRFHEVAPRLPNRGEMSVRIDAASVNFRDVMLAMGTIPGLETETSFGHQYLGLDSAGRIEACGDEVTGFAPGDPIVAIVPGAFASRSVTSAHLVARRPVSLTPEQAAAVPCAFVTAHYALNRLARLAPGERVLIHAATGGVGLAALQIARRVGATVFATAGSPAKRDWLAAQNVPHVMDSRSLRFADEVLDATNGEGVDVVLNSLTGEALGRSLALLRPYGRFLEIGKRDIFQDNRLGMLAFRKNLSFFAIDLDRLCAERPAFVGELLREVMRAFDDGSYEPLPQTIFSGSEVEKALRLMAQAKHIGKIVLSMTAGPSAIVPAADAPLFDPDGTYLITGGLGGFGLAVARWMGERGARHVTLMGRSGVTPERQSAVAELRATGLHVEVFAGDVARQADVESVVQRIRSSTRPLRGVLHAAMVLDDAPLESMDATRFERVLAPKMGGAWNLHLATRNDPLDHFVLFSSIASLLGNQSQANYAAANAFLDTLAHARRREGLPALTVNWGVLSGVGYVSRHSDVAGYLGRQGYESFTPDQALSVLGSLMRRDAVQVMVARIDWPKWAKAGTATITISPRLRHLVPSSQQPVTAASAGQRRVLDDLRALESASAREQRLAVHLRDRVAHILGASPDRIDLDRPLTELGTDSLTAVELSTALKLDFGVELPLVRILQGISTRRLVALVLESLHFDSGVPSVEPVNEPAPAVVAAHDSGAPSDGESQTACVEASAPAVSLGGSGHGGHGSDVRPEPRRNGHWSPLQRVARGSITLAFRTLTSVHVEGLEHLPVEGPVVLAVNHLSMMDVPLALTVLPRHATMMAAEYLKRSRLMDWFLAGLGEAIYVARGTGDIDAVERAIDVLRCGRILALAPEGTRSRTGGLGRGQTGAAYLATQTGAPIVPLVAWGQERMGDSWRRFRRAPIAVRIGPPVHLPSGPASSASLRDYTDLIMQALAAELPPEYRGAYLGHSDSATAV